MISQLLPDEKISRELLEPTPMNPFIDKRYRLTGFPESWREECRTKFHDSYALIDRVASPNRFYTPSIDNACCGEMTELSAKIQSAKKKQNIKLAEWRIVFNVPGYYERFFMAPFRSNMPFKYRDETGILDYLMCSELVEDLDLKDPQYRFEIEPTLGIDPTEKREKNGITDKPFVVEMSLFPTKILSS